MFDRLGGEEKPSLAEPEQKGDSKPWGSSTRHPRGCKGQDGGFIFFFFPPFLAFIQKFCLAI